MAPSKKLKNGAILILVIWFLVVITLLFDFVSPSDANEADEVSNGGGGLVQQIRDLRGRLRSSEDLIQRLRTSDVSGTGESDVSVTQEDEESQRLRETVKQLRNEVELLRHAEEHKTKPKVAIFMAFNNRPKIANWSVENKQLYSKMHGYDLVVDPPEAISADRPPAWHKIRGVQRILNKYNWVCWFDVDTVITDMKRCIEDVVNPRYDFVVARTFEYMGAGEETHDNEFRLNTGTFCVQNTTWAHMFLQMVYDKTDYVHHGNWEQRAIQVLLRDNHDLWPHVQYLDQHELNVHNWFWHDGDFVLHYYGGMQGCPSQFDGCENHFIYMCKMAKEKAGFVEKDRRNARALLDIRMVQEKAQIEGANSSSDRSRHQYGLVSIRINAN